MTKDQEIADLRKRLAAANRDLEKYPKGSFICIRIVGKSRKEWGVETSIRIDDHDSVRKNNELLRLYEGLDKDINPKVDIAYIEEGQRHE